MKKEKNENFEKNMTIFKITWKLKKTHANFMEKNGKVKIVGKIKI